MVVIGVAVIERESWVLSGFVPETDSETERLNAEINGLAFHPCEKPHDLKAGKNDQASRSPKRVLKVLTSDNWERQRKCWVETPLAALEGRGRDNGLVDYMNEVRERLVPFIASVNEV